MEDAVISASDYLDFADRYFGLRQSSVVPSLPPRVQDTTPHDVIPDAWVVDASGVGFSELVRLVSRIQDHLSSVRAIHLLFAKSCGPADRLLRVLAVSLVRLRRNGLDWRILGILTKEDKVALVTCLDRRVQSYVETVAFRYLDSRLVVWIKRLKIGVLGAAAWSGPVVVIAGKEGMREYALFR